MRSITQQELDGLCALLRLTRTVAEQVAFFMKFFFLDGFVDYLLLFGGQLSGVVKASDMGAEGSRFEPWQQHLVQLS